MKTYVYTVHVDNEAAHLWIDHPFVFGHKPTTEEIWEQAKQAIKRELRRNGESLAESNVIEVLDLFSETDFYVYKVAIIP